MPTHTITCTQSFYGHSKVNLC